MIRPQFPTKETKDVAVPNILNNVKVSVPNIYTNKQNMERFRLRNCRKGPAVVQLYYAETYETLRPDNKSFLFHSNEITRKCNRFEIVYYSFHHESHFHDYYDNFIPRDKSMKC